MFLDKNWQFSHIFISAKKWRGNVFDDILERENTFVPNKNNKFLKKNKLVLFQRGYSMVLVKNCKFFDIFISAK